MAVALSAALPIASDPPFPLGGLAWIALVPLFLALRRAGTGALVPVVRSASTSVSAMIAADGRVAARLRDERGEDVDAHGTLAGEIPLGEERASGTRQGDWFVAASRIADWRGGRSSGDSGGSW